VMAKPALLHRSAFYRVLAPHGSHDHRSTQNTAGRLTARRSSGGESPSPPVLRPRRSSSSCFTSSCFTPPVVGLQLNEEQPGRPHHKEPPSFKHRPRPVVHQREAARVHTRQLKQARMIRHDPPPHFTSIVS
jgi:hypothetical protein